MTLHLLSSVGGTPASAAPAGGAGGGAEEAEGREQTAGGEPQQS